MTPTKDIRQLRDYLKILLRRTALLHVASGAVTCVAMMAWVVVALVVWTAVTGAPSLGFARAVSIGVMAAAVLVIAIFLVWPLVRMPRLERLVSEIEKRRDLRELLRAGYEFSTQSEKAGRYSPDLVREVIHRATREISGLRVRGLFLSRRKLAFVPVAYGGLVVLLVGALVSPGDIVEALQRVVSPAAVADRAHRANIYAQPGNITVLAGKNVTVSGLDLGRGNAPMSIRYTISDNFWKTAAASPARGVDVSPGPGAGQGKWAVRGAGAVTSSAPSTRRLSRASAARAVRGDARPFRRYEYTFDNLRHTLHYAFESGGVSSPEYTITVVHPPMLTNLRVTLTPPRYTGVSPSVLTDNGGNVQALEGTHVHVDAVSNNALAGAWLKFSNKKKVAVSARGRDVSFDFDALEDGSYAVILKDTLGFSTDEPLEYSVEVFRDHAPSLDVIAPGEDTMLPRSRKVSVSFLAGDDYGVASAALYSRKTGEERFVRTSIPLGKQDNPRETAVAWEWKLGDVSLFPGNAIEYFLQVADNNVVTGPGVTKSHVYRISVPTMAELFDRSQKEDEHRGDMMDQALQNSREFRKKLQKITQEYVKTEKMEWSQKKQVDRALDKQKDVERQLDAVRQSLDQTLKELSENRMTSEKIGEKMEEIRDLLNQIDNDEIRKRMEELRTAVEKLKPEDIRDALKNLNVDTKQMLATLERTAELLRQVQKEQKMEEVVRKTRDMMESQNDLNHDTAESKSGDNKKMKKLADRQEQLARRSEELASSMDALKKMMEREDKQTAQEMQRMSEQIRSPQGSKKNMKNAAQQLRQKNKQSAMQEQQQAMDKMISLFRKASQAQKQMQQSGQKKLAHNFQKFARQTLELSKRQESLAGEISRDNGITGTQKNTDTMAERQMSYLRSANKVSDEVRRIAGQSTAVSSQLIANLDQARQRMESSVMFLEQNKAYMSKAHATNAVESLNNAVIEMLRGAQQCTRGSPQGSGKSAAQQLMEQLIPQQQSVVKQTRKMLEMQAAGEKLRQQRQAELKRLSGQQRSAADLAKQIEKSMQDNRQLLGRLDRTSDEMESIAKAIEKGDVSDDLLGREYHILSRLLDSQRSVQTRDYENKRESEVGANIFSNGGSTATRSERMRTLREEIKKAMRLKAPGEFEDLIKLYFRALAEESSAQGAQRSN